MQRSPSPGPPPKRRWGTTGDDGGCEGGGFSERSPSLALPPEERLAFELGGFSLLGSACELGRVLCGGLRSRRLIEPPRPSNVGKPANHGEHARIGIYACCGTSTGPQGDASRREVVAPADPQRCMVAAALSAAVTSTKKQGTAPTSQAEPTPKFRTPPNASRSSGERGLGGEALLSEKRPLPPASPENVLSSGGSAREGLLEKKPPPSHLSILFRRFCFVCRGVFGGGSFAD